MSYQTCILLVLLPLFWRQAQVFCLGFLDVLGSAELPLNSGILRDATDLGPEGSNQNSSSFQLCILLWIAHIPSKNQNIPVSNLLQLLYSFLEFWASSSHSSHNLCTCSSTEYKVLNITCALGCCQTSNQPNKVIG